MSTAQSAIFAPPSAHHLFLEFSLPDGEAAGDMATTLGEARALLLEHADVRTVVGFGRELWGRLAPQRVPAALQPFRTMVGRRGKQVPGTQNDLWWWLSGPGPDVLLAAGLALSRRLALLATLRLEQQAFQYLDSRDLTGFVDGTANPEPKEAPRVALVPDGEPGAGGSYVIAMRWVHNLTAFHDLPVAEQERVIGRTKADSVELPEADMPDTAHISRVEIERDGEELAIFRRSVPFGGIEEHGLMFLAFAKEPQRYNEMLRRMFGLAEDGLEDRLIDFSRVTHAAYYFAPSEDDLKAALG